MSNIFMDAASLAKAVAIQVAAGFPLATKEQQKERHDICGECPLMNKEGYRCGVCNCYLLVKIPLATSTCPSGYWGAVNE